MPSLVIPLLLVGLTPWAAFTLRRATGLLHILQLEEYESARFLRWIGADYRRAVSPGLPSVLLVLAATFVLSMLGLLSLPVAAVVAALGGVGAFLRHKTLPAKKPLVFTKKALVVLGLTAILWLVPLGVCFVLIGELGLLIGVAISDLLLPVELVAANVVLYLPQSAAKLAVVQMARRRLRASKAKIVGITGSYGKTSTKEILAALLSERFRCLKTPASYNTPLGISSVVLRQLRPEHQVFVVEMGAYVRGNIRQLCRLAPPEIGILTAVAPQHLERFGSIENIARTKYELIESLPSDGTAIFNYDNRHCRALADRTTGCEVIRYGLDPSPSLDLTARSIRVTRRGLEFRLVTKSAGEADVRLRLLGEHNVANFLAAAAAAMALGMTVEEIARAAGRVEPVPHRLQLIEGAGGVTVIDDAYNSNPDGARAALRTLQQIAEGRKVLVTPGMVELGAREESENRALGEAAAKVCDAVILVGPKRTRPIRDGLVAAGFPKEKIAVVKGIDEVPPRLQRLVGPGDVVLFENDLPDNYSE